MKRGRTAAAMAGFLLLTPASWGYIRIFFTYGDGSTAFLKRSDVTGAGLQFYINNLIAPGLQSNATGTATTVISSGSNPVLAIQNAIGAWNGMPGTALKFLPTQSTTKVNNSADGQNTIAVGSTAADLSVLGYVSSASKGVLALTISSPTGFFVGSSPTGDVTDTDIILNPAIAFSTDGSTSTDLQTVMTHELGHALGLSHSGLRSATMFAYSLTPNQRYLSPDEIAFATAIYPAKGTAIGSIAGKVAASDGSPVQTALVALVDTANGNSLSALTLADGTFTTAAPAGSYVIYAEPLNGNSVVYPGNFYLPATTPVTTNFEATVLGGLANPTKVTVAAGAAVTAPNLVVSSGANALTPPRSGIGKAGGSGDISPLTTIAWAVASGQSVDIGVTGGGVDNTSSLQVYGQGISIHAGTIHFDPASSTPMVRATLDIAPHQSPSIASVIVTQGASNTIALSGLLVIIPPPPSFTANGVVSGASYKGPGGSGGVSPGGIYSIYDTVNNTLGPTAFAQPAGYNLQGNLATTLGGVTVTFDGVPAPMFLAYSAQLNLQAPLEIAGKTTTQVVVNFYGSQSAPVAVPVVATQPAFFTVTPLGTDAVIQNFPDYSLNSASNPIARGGVVLLYGTGLGNLGYSLATGQPGIVPPSSYASKYSCSFGGVSTSAYAYWNYGFVGEATWTVTVPSNAPAGAVSLTCTDSVSGGTTQQGTIYLK
jgi:uncharacterized protein (TIGR03437 family)